MDQDQLLHISSSPHIRDPQTVPAIMRDVVIALIPALLASIYFFGPRALIITFVAVLFSLLTEQVRATKMLKRPSPLGDLSAVVTGILLAFNLPVSIPLYLVAIGAVFAIGVVKWTFGGLGGNFMNPALAGRAFLLASSMATMTGAAFHKTAFAARLPHSLSGLNDSVAASITHTLKLAPDAISGATPLAALNTITDAGAGSDIILQLQSAFKPLFIGNVGGTIGETSVIALLIGALYLFWRRIINFTIPLTYIGVTFLLFWIFNGVEGVSLLSAPAMTIPVYQVLSGGLILGAFFMATDMVTCPITARGQFIFAAGAGLLTFLIRRFGGYPEGVSYSILLMNILTPLIDKYVRPKVFGVEVQS